MTEMREPAEFGGAYGIECDDPRCTLTVLAHDEVMAAAEARHGHPGDDCAETPRCTERLERAFLLEHHAGLSPSCLQALALPVLGDGALAMDRRTIVRRLPRPLAGEVVP
jgi:hypothetical protein